MRRFALFLLVLSPLAAQQPMHLTLADAQRLAVQQNPQFSSARSTAAAAHQVPPQYRANYQPSVSGSITAVGADNGSRLAAGALNNPILYDHVGTGLTVGQLITDFGRTSNLVGMANLEAAAQDQTAEGVCANVLLTVSQAYFALLRAQAVLQVAQQTVAARQLVSDQATALAQAKLKSELDVSFANVNLADAKLLQVQAENDVHAAEANLAAAMGIPGQTGFSLADEPLPAPLPAQLDALLRTAAQNRPELKDLRLRQSAAERATRAEHDLYYPSVGVVGTAGFAPAGYHLIPDRYGAVGLNITIPVFNGGLFKARQTEAELKARAAAQNVSDLENTVTRDVRVAYLNATTAYDRLALTRQLLDQAQLALNLAQSRYNLGLSSIVELSQAQLNLTSAQIANASALYDYQGQRVKVDYEIGVLR